VALLEKRGFLYNHSGDFPQVILIIPSHVPNNLFDLKIGGIFLLTMTHARIVASASTSSGLERGCPSGPSHTFSPYIYIFTVHVTQDLCTTGRLYTPFWLYLYFRRLSVCLFLTYRPEMEFWDINLTKDYSLMLHAMLFTVPSTGGF